NNEVHNGNVDFVVLSPSQNSRSNLARDLLLREILVSAVEVFYIAGATVRNLVAAPGHNVFYPLCHVRYDHDRKSGCYAGVNSDDNVSTLDISWWVKEVQRLFH